ncbi:DUF421 domain-containing protein [Hutsoniella sourekii]|uniref:DUF421 domain-containing protein n=1 Tax=Hutsoniella sourekii TaxID=87650 RepID=UPI000482108B|nr:YetF domain-containing protein [Hutsoniella sourekii]
MQEYLLILGKLIIGGLAAFVLFRLMGKKAISDLTPFDMLFTLILGGIVTEPLYDTEASLVEILFALVVWGFVMYVLQRILATTGNTSQLIEGKPDLIIYHSRIQVDNLKKNHLKMEQVRKLLRQEGYYNIADVYHLILEVDGSVTVIPTSKKDEFSVMVIDQGEIDHDVLDELMGKDEAWLMHQLALQSCPLNEVYYGEVLANDQLQLIRYHDLAGNELDNIDE